MKPSELCLLMVRGCTKMLRPSLLLKVCNHYAHTTNWPLCHWKCESLASLSIPSSTCCGTPGAGWSKMFPGAWSGKSPLLWTPVNRMRASLGTFPDIPAELRRGRPSKGRWICILPPCTSTGVAKTLQIHDAPKKHADYHCSAGSYYIKYKCSIFYISSHFSLNMVQFVYRFGTFWWSWIFYILWFLQHTKNTNPEKLNYKKNNLPGEIDTHTRRNSLTLKNPDSR